jgi:hypothetical protein
VLRKRGEHIVDVGIVKARADDAGLEIVMTDDRGDAAEIAKRPLVQAEKRGELLIPHRLFVPVPRMAQRQAKHPRALPLARRGIERRRAPKKIGLAFLPGLTFEDADGAPARRHRPQVPFHRLVTVPVAELFGEVLPDPLRGQSLGALLKNRIMVLGGGEPGGRLRAGERFGRFCLRAGERFGRI